MYVSAASAPNDVVAKAGEKVSNATDLKDTIVRQQSKLEQQLDELKAKSAKEAPQ